MAEAKIKLDGEDVKNILSNLYGVPRDNISFENDLLKSDIYVVVCQTVEPNLPPEAYWEYRTVWSGNGGRIDDATCSNCGCKHPIIRNFHNNPNQFYKFCPICGKRMGNQERR